MATMLVLVSWGMVDTVQILLEQQFVRIQRNDAVLLVGGRSVAAVGDDVRSESGVAAVEAALIVPVAIVAADGSYSTTLTALQPGSTMHELVGPARVHWRDGIRRMIEVRNPELLPSRS